MRNLYKSFVGCLNILLCVGLSGCFWGTGLFNLPDESKHPQDAQQIRELGPYSLEERESLSELLSPLEQGSDDEKQIWQAAWSSPDNRVTYGPRYILLREPGVVDPPEKALAWGHALQDWNEVETVPAKEINSDPVSIHEVIIPTFGFVKLDLPATIIQGFGEGLEIRSLDGDIPQGADQKTKTRPFETEKTPSREARASSKFVIHFRRNSKQLFITARPHAQRTTLTVLTHRQWSFTIRLYRESPFVLTANDLKELQSRGLNLQPMREWWERPLTESQLREGLSRTGLAGPEQALVWEKATNLLPLPLEVSIAKPSLRPAHFQRTWSPMDIMWSVIMKGQLPPIAKAVRLKKTKTTELTWLSLSIEPIDRFQIGEKYWLYRYVITNQGETRQVGEYEIPIRHLRFGYLEDRLLNAKQRTVFVALLQTGESSVPQIPLGTRMQF